MTLASGTCHFYRPESTLITEVLFLLIIEVPSSDVHRVYFARAGAMATEEAILHMRWNLVGLVIWRYRQRERERERGGGCMYRDIIQYLYPVVRTPTLGTRKPYKLESVSDSCRTYLLLFRESV